MRPSHASFCTRASSRPSAVDNGDRASKSSRCGRWSGTSLQLSREASRCFALVGRALLRNTALTCTPGRPSSASTSRPLSSAKHGMPAASAAISVAFFNAHFQRNVSQSSTTSTGCERDAIVSSWSPGTSASKPLVLAKLPRRSSSQREARIRATAARYRCRARSVRVSAPRRAPAWHRAPNRSSGRASRAESVRLRRCPAPRPRPQRASQPR